MYYYYWHVLLFSLYSGLICSSFPFLSVKKNNSTHPTLPVSLLTRASVTPPLLVHRTTSARVRHLPIALSLLLFVSLMCFLCCFFKLTASDVSVVFFVRFVENAFVLVFFQDFFLRSLLVSFFFISNTNKKNERIHMALVSELLHSLSLFLDSSSFYIQ